MATNDYIYIYIHYMCIYLYIKTVSLQAFYFILFYDLDLGLLLHPKCDAFIIDLSLTFLFLLPIGTGLTRPKGSFRMFLKFCSVRMFL